VRRPDPGVAPGYLVAVSVGPVRRASGALLAVVVATACQSSQESPSRGAAESFYGAIAAQDGRTACDLLTPATRSELEKSAGKHCEEAVLEELDPVEGTPSVDVYGTMAQARYDGETAFLTRFPDGWRVVAAGCTPAEADRYDCSVKGS
jgi:hypothetical protein